MPSIIGFNLFNYEHSLYQEVVNARDGLDSSTEVFPFGEVPRRNFDRNYLVILTNRPVYTYSDYTNLEFLRDPISRNHEIIPLWQDISRAARVMAGHAVGSAMFARNLNVVLGNSREIYRGPFVWNTRNWTGMVFSNRYLLARDISEKVATAFRSINRILHENKNRYMLDHDGSSAGFSSLHVSRLLYGIKNTIEIVHEYVRRSNEGSNRSDFLCMNVGRANIVTAYPTLKVYRDIARIIDVNKPALRMVYDSIHRTNEVDRLKDFISYAIPVMRSMSSRDMSDECFKRIIKGSVARG